MTKKTDTIFLGFKTKDPRGNMKIPGYFTVEAAMIFPYVIGTILLVVYIWFFLYDRCLQELDASLVAVRGSTQQELNLSERCDYTKDLWNRLYKDEYFSWEWTDATVDIEKNILNVQVGGQLEFPFPGFNFWGGDDVWRSETTQYGKIIKRTLLLRTARHFGKR